MRHRILRAAKLAAIPAVLIVAIGLGWVANTVLTEPDCPTEDSCVADYREGGWHIDEIVP